MSVGCSDPEGCRTTQDCFDQGLGQKQCVNTVCVATCDTDSDCRADSSMSQAICERGTCAAGCPAEACGDGESCVDGRCSVYFQSFEIRPVGGFVDLAQLGWNDITRELRNKAAEIVWKGPPTCTAADRPERCAGPAADGEYYLAVERQKTPPTSTLEFGVTCGACACCRACTDSDPLAREGAFATACFGTTLPAVNMCSATPPAACTAICDSCEQCPATMAGGVGTGLDACAARAAAKTCTGCPPYDQCVLNKVNENRACPGNYPACAANPPQDSGACRTCLEAECANLRAPCWACRDAAQLKKDFPAQPDRWRDLEMQCETQGPAGCYTTPVNKPRSTLSDDEQALESPAIPLAGIDGNLILQLQYVPFDIRRTYRRVIQGQDASSWPIEPQEVEVQLCASACETAASWTKAATIPSDAERGNGLQFAAQSSADWRVAVVEVPIPEAMRTATFRFRFVPRMEDDARIGIDRVLIRRKP